jgi:hypothetical protein
MLTTRKNNLLNKFLDSFIHLHLIRSYESGYVVGENRFGYTVSIGGSGIIRNLFKDECFADIEKQVL